MRLDDLLRRQPGTRDREPFFDEHGAAITLHAFEAMVARALRFFDAQGLRPGDRIALWLTNRIEWPALLFAAARAGLAIAALNTRYRASEIENIVAMSEASILLFEPRFASTDAASVLETVDFARVPGLRKLVMLENEEDSSPSFELPLEWADLRIGEVDEPSRRDEASDPDAPLIFFSTSGTTSAPKLVTHCQRTLSRHAGACAARFGFAEQRAAFLAAMPLCGIFGLSAFLAAVAGGAPVHLLPSFEAGKAASIIRRRAITHLIGSDEMFRRLLDVDASVLDATRLCGYASFTPGLEGRIRQAAERGVPFRGVYGSSEVNAIFAVQPPDIALEERLKAGGQAADPAARIRVRDKESGRLLGPGETGEIEIAAPANFLFYLGNAAATANAVDDEGYFRTGDVGYLREDGSFVYIARSGDAIRLSGFLVDPAEIETAVKECEGVQDAQVVGVLHEGQTRPIAFVVLQSQGADFDHQAALATLRKRLAPFKAPTRLIPVDRFPTTEGPNGAKVTKSELRRMAELMISRVDAPAAS